MKEESINFSHKDLEIIRHSSSIIRIELDNVSNWHGGFYDWCYEELDALEELYDRKLKESKESKTLTGEM